MFEDDEKVSDDSGAEDTTTDEKADGDSEGQAEDTSEKGEDKDKSGENGDKKEPKGNRFFDPNKVPPELKPAYNAMMASFTRKMQGMSRFQQKAQAFDELVNNPEFQSWVNGRNEPRSKRAKDDDDDEGAGNSKTDDMDTRIERAVQKAISPLIQSEYRKTAKTEWADLLEKYPQAEHYRAEIREAMEETPGLSYAKAFKQVAFDDAIEVGEEGAVRKISNKKAASTEKPSRINPGDKPEGRPKTIPEAFKLAVKQQRKG